MAKMCIYEPEKVCDNCGDCKCDLDPTKVCDNCFKCLDLMEGMDYANIPIEAVCMEGDETSYDLSGITMPDKAPRELKIRKGEFRGERKI